MRARSHVHAVLLVVLCTVGLSVAVPGQAQAASNVKCQGWTQSISKKTITVKEPGGGNVHKADQITGKALLTCAKKGKVQLKINLHHGTDSQCLTVNVTKAKKQFTYSYSYRLKNGWFDAGGAESRFEWCGGSGKGKLPRTSGGGGGSW